MDNINPQERVSLMDLLGMLKELLPFWSAFEAMLTGGGDSFEPTPAPADSVDKSSEVIVRELTVKEKALYTGLCLSEGPRLTGNFYKMLWETIWANLDIKCPHGIAIRDDYKVVRLSADSKPRSWFSISPKDTALISCTGHIDPQDIPALRELATTLLAKTEGQNKITVRGGNPTTILDTAAAHLNDNNVIIWKQDKS
ncbi:MAG: hypothetical protein Q7T51_02935 [Candidatus Moranbacteria bacterium]|nr:hypothetical protein [Candidatus Moranbacteria bacterium]